MRLLVAGLFAFQLNYVPIHLATAAHFDGVVQSPAKPDVHHHHHHHHGHHHDHHGDPQDSNGHVPHSPSDHTLALPGLTPAPHGAAALMVFLLPLDGGVVLFPPSLPSLPLVFERIRPPGESVPGPLQPRAPPPA